MATWSAAEVANETLKVLGIVGVGQTAAAEDLERVTTAYTSVYRRLRRLGLAPWASGAIEDDAKEPVAKVLAGETALKFGFSGQRLAEMKMIGQEGMRELQEVYSSQKQEVPVQNTYW